MKTPETPMDWIYDHPNTIVSFHQTTDSNRLYGFKALTIRMKFPLCKTITKRHLEYTPTDDILIDILDEMYKNLLLALLSH